MAAYTMKSDKIFLRCLDMGTIEVYELDNIYIFPVKGKYWSRLGISIGPGKMYEMLKFGDREISGADLQTVTKDLFNSQLIVNREGLCFLPTTGVRATLLEVEYYRLFDLFDWSKYQVKTLLNTRWARSDFMDGRPLEISDSKEVINELRGKHDQELGALEKRKGEELDKIQAELDGLKKKIKDLEEELKLYVFKRSGLTYPNEFYIRMMKDMQTALPPSKIRLESDSGFQVISPWPDRGTCLLTVPLMSVESMLPSLPQKVLIRHSSIPSKKFDFNNWRVIKLAFALKLFPISSSIMAYYDGSMFLGSHTESGIIPVPCPAQCVGHYKLIVINIIGVGVRVAFEFEGVQLQ